MLVTKTELKEKGEKPAEEVIEDIKNGYQSKEEKKDKAMEVVDEYCDFTDMNMDNSRVLAVDILPEEFEIDNPFWEGEVVHYSTKSSLVKEVSKLLGKLGERHNVHFEEDFIIKNVWELASTDFEEKDTIAVYYPHFQLPLLIEMDTFMLAIAPKTE